MSDNGSSDALYLASKVANLRLNVLMQLRDLALCEFLWVSTHLQKADIFTKELGRLKYESALRQLSLLPELPLLKSRL